MKTAILLLILLPIFAAGQYQQDTTGMIHYKMGGEKFRIKDSSLYKFGNLDTVPIYTRIKQSDFQIGTGNFEPAHRIVIAGRGKERLNIDFKGDSMVVTGDMKLTEGARKFIDYCRQYFKTKIDSLEMELKKEREISKPAKN